MSCISSSRVQSTKSIIPSVSTLTNCFGNDAKRQVIWQRGQLRVVHVDEDSRDDKNMTDQLKFPDRVISRKLIVSHDRVMVASINARAMEGERS